MNNRNTLVPFVPGVPLPQDPAMQAYSRDKVTAYNALAGFCPGTGGGAVHQARALYQFITGRVFNSYADCGDEGARKAQQEEQKVLNEPEQWDLHLFPNPVSDKLVIKSTQEFDQLTVVIRDLAGRMVFRQDVVTKDFHTELNPMLPNGAYLISVKSADNGVVTKMLLINR